MFSPAATSEPQFRQMLGLPARLGITESFFDNWSVTLDSLAIDPQPGMRHAPSFDQSLPMKDAARRCGNMIKLERVMFCLAEILH
jgi:hypothetical protein